MNCLPFNEDVCPICNLNFNLMDLLEYLKQNMPPDKAEQVAKMYGYSNTNKIQMKRYVMITDKEKILMIKCPNCNTAWDGFSGNVIYQGNS